MEPYNKLVSIRSRLTASNLFDEASGKIRVRRYPSPIGEICYIYEGYSKPVDLSRYDRVYLYTRLNYEVSDFELLHVNGEVNENSRYTYEIVVRGKFVYFKFYELVEKCEWVAFATLPHSFFNPDFYPGYPGSPSPLFRVGFDRSTQKYTLFKKVDSL